MKTLTAPHMERCIGCLLCVLVAGRGAGAISLNSPLIRIVRRQNRFVAEIDSGLPAPASVVEICPRNCLKLIES